MPNFDFGSLAKKSEKVPDKKNISDSQDKKITPKDNDQKIAATKHENIPKSDLETKEPIISSFPVINGNTVDNKINEIVNDRILQLVKLGLRHELTIENMLQYFREVEMAKLYELKRYFSDSPGHKIEKVLKFLYSSGELKKDRNNWYSLK